MIEISCRKLSKRGNPFLLHDLSYILGFTIFEKDNPVLNVEKEIWKDLVSFEGRYQVSSYGNIRSILTNHGKYQERLKKPRQRSKTCKYLYVQLSVKDKAHHEAIHRAVAKAFIPNPDNKPFVNHIDSDRYNNHVYNLEWVTASENIRHGYEHGFMSGDHITERQIGLKSGKSSRFHNVSWDNTRQKWKATLKDKRKMIFQKRFDCEYEAAAYVNHMLDKLGYSDRPRNFFD